jgi:hypothetical protein
MSGVLTTASTVTCGHGAGKVQTSSSAKLKVNGAPVLLKSSIDRRSVSGCVTPVADDPSPAGRPCTAVTSAPAVPPAPPPLPPGVTAGEATKLKAGGQPVMLDTLKGSTNGMVAKTSPQPTLAGTAGQTKLTAV